MRPKWLVFLGSLVMLVFAGCARTPQQEAARTKAWVEYIVWFSDGRLVYDQKHPQAPIIEVHLDNSAILDGGLRDLGKLPGLQTLSLQTCLGVTDAGLAFLTGLTELKTLDLRETSITENGLIHLRGLKSLESLNLAHNRSITGAALNHLLDLPRLRRLDVRDTAIGDEEIAHFKKLKRTVRIIKTVP